MRQELLIRYAIFLAEPGSHGYQIHDDKPLSEDEMATVKAHVDTCPSCSSRVEEYRRSYLSNRPASVETIEQDLPPSDCCEEAISRNWRDWQEQVQWPKRLTNIGRIAAIAAVLFIAAGLSIIIADHITRPGHYKLASVSKDHYDQIVLYRERNSLLQAIFLFRSGEYEKAITALEACLATRDGHNMRPYLRLMQGLAHLKLVESTTFGLFPRFDLNRAEVAIVTFQACVDDALNSEMVNVRALAYIYQAKAYLMSGNVAMARQALENAVATGAEPAEEARQMLVKLNGGEPKS